MPKKRIAVILFPGSNCELEAVRACKRSQLDAEIFRWNDKHSKLKSYDAYILPGGFSYEDRGRSGVIASKDPIMAVIQQESEKGKPVLGICNGAQILIECGLIPGFNKNHLEMALANNERIKNNTILGTGFYNDWVYVRHQSTPGRSVFNNFAQHVTMRIPVAHAEGRFTTRQKEVLQSLVENEQALFRYCDKNGKFTNEFPVNPNGALYNLAGVCNPQGHILALMPHPERSNAGQPIFDSLKKYLEQGRKTHVKKVKIVKKPNLLEEKRDGQFQKPDLVILINLIITDNEERTMENTLLRLGYRDIALKRQIYLGFYLENNRGEASSAATETLAEKLIRSGEILNINKEIPTVFINNKTYLFDINKGLIENNNKVFLNSCYLVQEYDNYTGKSIQNRLKTSPKSLLRNYSDRREQPLNYEGFSGIVKIERGVFWEVKTKNKNKVDKMIKSHMFHNPHSMKLVTLN